MFGLDVINEMNKSTLKEGQCMICKDYNCTIHIDKIKKIEQQIAEYKERKGKVIK